MEEAKVDATSSKLAFIFLVWMVLGFLGFANTSLFQLFDYSILQIAFGIVGTAIAFSSPKPSSASFVFHPIFILTSMIFCFPIGLVLIWKKPAWSTLAKQLFSGFAFLIFFNGLANSYEDALLKNEAVQAKKKASVSQNPKSDLTSKDLTHYDKGFASGDATGKLFAKNMHANPSVKLLQAQQIREVLSEVKRDCNAFANGPQHLADFYKGRLEGFQKAIAPTGIH